MLEQLLTEQQNPASAGIDCVPTDAALRIIHDADRAIGPAIEAAIPQLSRAVDSIVERMNAGGRLFYIGAGTSGRLGVLDASECPPTYGVSPDLIQGIIAGGDAALSRATEASEDDPAAGAADLLERGFTSGDVAAGIAASGRTPYVIGAIRKARSIGGLTIGLSCTPNAALSDAAEIPIEILTGPEVITGSTRMKAGTATKLALNMISTTVMIRLGYVYGNLMVNVQPKNEKLVDRATRIIADAAGIGYEEAARLLAETGDVKTSIVMGKCGLGRKEAEAHLARARGILAGALAASD